MLYAALREADQVFCFGAREGKAALGWDPAEALAPLGERAASFHEIDALVLAPGTRTVDWPGLRTWSSISRRLTMFFWWIPSGVTQGEASSSRAFGATTGADWVSGVNQTSVPAKADWEATRPVVSRSCRRMVRDFIRWMVGGVR